MVDDIKTAAEKRAAAAKAETRAVEVKSDDRGYVARDAD